MSFLPVGMTATDFLIVGAGFSGLVVAERLSAAGWKCVVVDKRDHFGGNGNGNLLRRHGSDLETHGGVEALKCVRRDAFLLQFLDHRDHFALAADHGDVTSAGRNGPPQHPHIIPMSPRHDDQITGFVDVELREDLLVLGGIDRIGLWETLPVRNSPIRICPRVAGASEPT